MAEVRLSWNSNSPLKIRLELQINSILKPSFWSELATEQPLSLTTISVHFYCLFKSNEAFTSSLDRITLGSALRVPHNTDRIQAILRLRTCLILYMTRVEYRGGNLKICELPCSKLCPCSSMFPLPYSSPVVKLQSSDSLWHIPSLRRMALDFHYLKIWQIWQSIPGFLIPIA